MTDSSGAVVGPSNGEYITDEAGRIVITDLEPGITVTAREIKTLEGYVLDGAPKSIEIKAGEVQTLRFYNEVKGTLVIRKLDSVTKEPLAGVEFQLTYAEGGYVDAANGHLSSLGLYTTDQNGEIRISGVTGAIVVKETKTIPGYTIDPAAQTQTVTVNPADTQTLTFYNTPGVTLVIEKYIEGTTTPLEGVTFLVTDSAGTPLGPSNGEYVTDRNGQIILTDLIPGTTITAREVRTVDGFVLDGAPQSILIKEGGGQRLTFYNTPIGGVEIVKINTVDPSERIPNVTLEIRKVDDELIDTVTTDENGRAFASLEDGAYYAVEIKAAEGFQLDDTPHYFEVEDGKTTVLQVENTPAGGVEIIKVNEAGPSERIPNVTFELRRVSNDELIDTVTTGRDGRVYVPLEADSYYLVETDCPQDFRLDPTPIYFTVEDGETAFLQVENTPVGGVEIIKVNEADPSERIPDVTFEIRRVSNDELIDTVTTGQDGRVYVPLEADSYYLVETDCPQDFRLDPTPIYFTVEDGETTRQTVTNTPFSGVLIHKIDSTTGEGIPNVTFLVYDSTQTPIDQITTDQNGYAYLDSLTFSGKLYLRELEAQGYLVDQDLKTVSVKPGETTLVEWENTPITGQIQITKTSADYTPTNGWSAGAPLPGVEFEVYDLANNLVDTIQTDKNGLAVSRPLPLGRYKVVESKSIDFYALDPTPIYAEIEFSGQIVRLAATNQSVSTGVGITKTGFGEVMPGQLLWYDFSGITNRSSVSLSSFYWRDTLPVEAVRLERVVTGTYNVPGSYKIIYRTNLSGENWRTLADSLSTSENYDLTASPAALGLAANEYVTEVMAVFGVVPASFRQVEAPRIYCTAVSWLQNGQEFVNQADVGGVYNGQWIQAVSRWVTRVYRPSEPLPKTGY